MRRPATVPTAALLLVLLALPLAGCGGDDEGTDPGTGACSIEIYSPDPGENIVVREQPDAERVDIRWHASGGGTVRIELLKAGAAVDTITVSTANDGYHAWTATGLDQISGDDYAIRVTSTADAACTDTLPVALTNVSGCVLELTVPADMTLTAGQDFLITWNQEHTSGELDVELWKGTVQEELVAVIAPAVPASGSYLWEDVDSFHRGTAGDYTLRITDPLAAGCDARSDYVRIVDEEICTIDVMAPVADQVFAEGDPMTVSFEFLPVDPGHTTVDIRLYAGFTLVPNGYIANGVDASSGEFVWPAVNDFGFGDENATNLYRIGIFDAEDHYCYGFSDKFTITPQ